MKILLHACCGPCSLEPVRLLAEQGHQITIAYMNSNIQPRAEYDHRLATLLAWAKDEGIPVVEGTWNDEAWKRTAGSAHAAGLPREDRCRACYRMRLEEAADYALSHGFEALSTTLTVSPYQYTEIIGEELAQVCEQRGLACVFEDFRPFYDNATRRSRDLGMYRQNYCGCAVSMREAEQERAQRRAQREAEKAKRAAERAPLEAKAAEERARKQAERAAYARKQHAKREMRNQARVQLKAQQAAEADSTRNGLEANAQAQALSHAVGNARHEAPYPSNSHTVPDCAAGEGAATGPC